jgi:hypothetical protein
MGVRVWSAGQGPLVEGSSMNGNIGDYLKFNKMVTPVIIQVLFWLFAALCVVVGLVTFLASAVGNNLGGAVRGILVIIFGPILVRIYAELLLVIFKIHDAVQLIAQKRTESTPSA